MAKKKVEKKEDSFASKLGNFLVLSGITSEQVEIISGLE